MPPTKPEERVLVMAPFGQDAEAMAVMLTGRGIPVTICARPVDAAHAIKEGAGALLLTEESLFLPEAAQLLGVLKGQPTWSEFPLIILTGGGESRIMKLLELADSAAGNVTLLERPMSAGTLWRSVQVALRSRRRQLQVRDLIADQQRRQKELEEAQSSLRDSERLFRTLVHASSQAVWHFRPRPELVPQIDRASASWWREFTGQSEEHRTSRNGFGWLDAVHDEDRKIAEDNWNKIVSGSEATGAEFRVRRHDGAWRWLLLRGVPIKDEKGAVFEWAGTVSDVTERRQAEELLRRAKEFDDAIMKNMGEGLYTVDNRGRVTSMNPAAERLLGWTFEELRGRKMHEMTHYKRRDGSDFPAEECAGLQVLRDSQTLVDLEDVFIRKDGSFFDVMFSSAPLREGGETFGLVVVFRDITERRRDEEAKGKLAALVAHSEDAIIGKDLNGIITSWNIGAERLFGYTANEAIGKPVTLLIPDDRLDEEPMIIERIRRGEAVEHFETVRRRKDGTLLDISLTISPVRDDRGRVVGVSKIARDISARRKAEDALRRAHEQLAEHSRRLEELVQERTANLARTNEQLRQEIAERQQAEATREELRRELLHAQEEERRRIARELHDQMGQNLTALNLGLKALQEADPRSSTLKRLVPPLQDLAAQTARDLHRVALELRPAALDDLGLANALRSLVESWSARCGIAADLEPGQYAARGVPSDIETTLYRIVQEALNNVAKHSGARHVSIILRHTSSHAQVIVEDDGRGFDAESTLHAAKVRGRLGLVGMRERLVLVGGALEVESAPGRGTTLLVRVPIPRTS
jgi:PAS domain S-box-containing protein